MTAHRDTINAHNAAADARNIAAIATHYTDEQAEAAKLDSTYDWYDVRISRGEGASKYEADFVVGVDYVGTPFYANWEGGDFFGEEGQKAAALAAFRAWKKGN